MPASQEHPPSAFRFTVAFAATSDEADSSFQEVSGIVSEIEVEPVVEGGENRFVHQLPRPVKHSRLVLKRGIAKTTSPLVSWCHSVIEGGLAAPIVPRSITVFLMNESGQPLRAWSFANVFPVKWDVHSLDSAKNEVAIETIELHYGHCNRVI